MAVTGDKPKYGPEVLDLSQKKFRKLQLTADDQKKKIFEAFSNLLDKIYLYNKTRDELFPHAEFLDDASGLEGHLDLIDRNYWEVEDFVEFPFKPSQYELEMIDMLKKKDITDGDVQAEENG